MDEVTDMLQRMRELLFKPSGVTNDADRAALDVEVQALKAEIDRIADTRRLTIKILNGSYNQLFQIGVTGDTLNTLLTMLVRHHSVLRQGQARQIH